MPILPLIAFIEIFAQFTAGASATVGTAYVSVVALETTMGHVGYIAGFGRRVIVGGLTIIGTIGGASGVVMIPDNLYIPPVEHVREITELTLIEHNYADVVTSQTDMPAFFDALYGQEVILVAVGTVTAGIDLTNLSEENIEFVRQPFWGGEYIIRVPEPTLLRCYLDEDKTYVAVRRRSVFAPSNTALDDSVRSFAIDNFVSTALEEDILEQTRQRFERIFEQTMLSLKVRGNYRIEYIPNDSPASTC